MNNQDYNFDNNSTERNIDFKKTFFRAFKYWYIIAISIIISIGLGYYSYQTTLPEYKISSLLLISDPESDNDPSVGSGENAMPGVSLGKYSNIKNQIVLLTSSDHIEKIIKQLDFSISYFQKDLFLYHEIYKNTPFIVVPDTTKIQLRNAEFIVEFSDDKTFIITNQKIPKEQFIHNFFEKFTIHGHTMTILPNEKITLNKQDYIEKSFSFKIETRETLVNNYRSKILITSYLKGSSIYEISISENNIAKGKDFLNKLSQSAVQYNLDKKNQIANNTIKFIEQQLVGVSDSLSSAEQVLEDFRSRNELMDVSMQGQMIINQSQELENQKSAILLKLDYYNYLVNYIENNNNVQELMAPSSMGVDNGILNQLISELSSKNAEKSSLQFNSLVENPNITRIDRHIKNLKQTILENTKSIITTTNITLNDLNNRLMNLSSQIRKLPKTEQLLLGIERKFKMNDDMYTYLLERRSEAQLAKAANLPDNEIVETATARRKVKPDQKKVIVIIIMIGLLLPSIIIFLIIFLNNKVQDKEDLESITKHPIIGEIPLKANEKDISFLDNPKSAFAESIRSIRTNINFYPLQNNCRTILVTSSIPGEGKSFFTLNLAVSYAQLGKKTLMIGFDLRRPTLSKYLDLKFDSMGMSKFLVNDAEKVNNHLIEPTNIPNLEVIPAGETPPNPAELIAGKHTDILFEELKKLYEVIIIDTPPIGLVTDALLLTKHSDINIITSRFNTTPKPFLNKVLNDGKLSSIKNICMILNGTNYSKNGYSYGYKGNYYEN